MGELSLTVKMLKRLITVITGILSNLREELTGF
jgi:hypothetical protein